MTGQPTPSGPDTPPAAPPAVRLPDAPALVLAGRHAVSVSADGEVTTLDRAGAVRLLEAGTVMVAQAVFLAKRLGRSRPQRRPGLFDVMELFAFARPAQTCIPTPRGLADALGLDVPADPPADPEDEAVTLTMAAHTLLTDLQNQDLPPREQMAEIAFTMGRGGWSWSPSVLGALGVTPNGSGAGGLDVWTRLTEWEERGPQGPRSSTPVPEAAVDTNLNRLLGEGRAPRPGQDAYARTAARAFQPREEKGKPSTVLLEAGTGIGKTIGYLAPASAWAALNGPGTWISTFTKNLQRQIDQELVRVYPDDLERRRRTAVRKGRENYICLLNYEDAVRQARGAVSAGDGTSDEIVRLGLVARWLTATRDGDMVGGDFPSWVLPGGTDSFGGGERGLTDRRGECIYAACAHYRKCAIERSVRKARHAHLVVANHALVLHQCALDHALAIARGTIKPGASSGKPQSGGDEPQSGDGEPQSGSGEPKTDGGESEAWGPERHPRLVFDEAHHLFDAADAAFGATLSGRECADLRRWIRGAESRRSQRARGLNDRLSDLLGDNGAGREYLDATLKAAKALPLDGWTQRLGEGVPEGPAERFLASLRRHVEARADPKANPDFGLEAPVEAITEELAATAQSLSAALDTLARPLAALSRCLRDRLEDEAEDLDTPTRARIDAATRGLDRRALLMLPGWSAMLQSLTVAGTIQDPPVYVDWFALERLFGRLADVAMHRRLIDPMTVFADAVVAPAHGVLITSASLRDEGPPPDGHAAEEVPPTKAPTADPTKAPAQDSDWTFARSRTGARHLAAEMVETAAIASPFDYPATTKVIIVRDVTAGSVEQVAGAYRALFEASGGGALGLFTAIQRLRAVHQRIAGSLEDSGLPLYAQHVDAMDVATLVDIFRADMNASLLGTDAARDGVDVPGRSLRLIVFDRVPWPRPDLLHKARRAHFAAHFAQGAKDGARNYDDALTRLRLKQAFGRLIRGPGDRGVFVLLDARMPTRLTSAFPPGVEVTRTGIKDAVGLVRDFLPQAPPNLST